MTIVRVCFMEGITVNLHIMIDFFFYKKKTIRSYQITLKACLFVKSFSQIDINDTNDIFSLLLNFHINSNSRLKCFEIT